MNLKKTIKSLFDDSSRLHEIVFLPLFFALGITYILFHKSTFWLEQFQGRPISLATSESLDIVKRVSTYYRGITTFFLLSIGLIISTVGQIKKISRSDLRILNLCGVAGFSLMFFLLLGGQVQSSMHLILAILFAAFAGILGKNIMSWEEKEDGEYMLLFGWTTMISTILFFLQWHILNLFSKFAFHSIPDFIGITTAVLLFVYFFLSKKFNFTFQSISKGIRVTTPLVLIPALSLLSFEGSMILGQRGMLLGPTPLYVSGLLILLFAVFRRYKKSQPLFTDAKHKLNTVWVPFLLVGIIGLVMYKPVVSPDIDWFEDGNRILPLQQWFDFGKIPFLDTFSSHAMSDWVWGALYSLFNGPDPMGVFVYGFLLGVVVTLLIYALVLRLSDNAFLSVFVALFYPYTDLLLPTYYHIVPLTVLLLLNILQKQSVKNYFLFFFLLLFTMVWRIDLGISNFMAGIGGLALLWFVHPDFNPDRKSALRGFGIFAVTSLFLFLIAILIQGPALLFDRLGEMAGYLSSLQAYGLINLSGATDMKYYSLYFIMPVAVALVAGFAFVKLIRNNEAASRASIVSVVIIFLSIFYFSNLQRGLVRHTLAEQWDTAFTSYGFFILVCPVFYSRKKSITPAIQFFSFFILATVITVNYKLNTPELDRSNVYNEVMKFVQGELPVKTAMKTDRTPERTEYRSDFYGDLDFWMKKNISDSSSFLDFSNSPMLYYYLGRKTPNYLCQIPHTAHNDEMQDRLLNGLKNYDLPVALFSNYPVSYWDQLDGIPNCMRHYKISEYIYKNYSPYALINHHTVWAKKNFTVPPLNVKTLVHYADLKNIAVSGAVLTDSISLRPAGSPQFDNMLHSPIALEAGKKYYVLLSAWFEGQGTITFVPNFNNKGYDDNRRRDARVYSGPSKAFFLIEPQAGENELSGIKILLSKDGAMSLSYLQLNSCDVIPDLVSELPVEYALNDIPYIWGRYDESWKAGKINSPLALIKETKTLNNGQGVSLSIPDHSNDSAYIYIRLSARAKTDQAVDMILRFGKDHETRGSYIFRIHPSPMMEDYVIRMSSLYLWHKKDKNWVTLYAMHGDAEIESVEMRREEP